MAKRDHSYNSGRIHRANSRQAEPQQVRSASPPPARKQKKKGGALKKVLISFALILAIGGGALFGLMRYVDDSLLDTGLLGTISSDKYTPKEFKGDVINILLVGVDYEEGRDHSLTDMIMYINYNLRDNQVNMLQIPRDTYVGNYSTDGKINAAMTTGADKSNPINNLVNVITEQYKLPVDRYIALDMDSMKEIVNILGPIRVYVPQEMNHAGSYLPQGWQWLDGDAAEFFVRNRYGTGFERADIDRLDNQRHFYSALFRRFLNLSAGDIMKLIPVIEYRCTTDFKATDMFDLAFTALNLESENIMICKAPGATQMEGYPNYYVIDIYGRDTEDEPGLAKLLNDHFRTFGDNVSAEAMASGAIPDVKIPSNITLYPVNVQWMGEVIESEGGADIDVEPTS